MPIGGTRHSDLDSYVFLFLIASLRATYNHKHFMLLVPIIYVQIIHFFFPLLLFISLYILRISLGNTGIIERIRARLVLVAKNYDRICDTERLNLRNSKTISRKGLRKISSMENGLLYGFKHVILPADNHF